MGMRKSYSVIASPEGVKPRHQDVGGSAEALWRKSNRSDCFVAALLAMTVAAVLFVSPALAMDDEISEYGAEQKARAAHELAATDMIYQQEEWKALYYQNIQIIALLKEIRELMQNQDERAAKADQKT